MHFQLAFIDSPDEVYLKSFSTGECKNRDVEKIISLEGLKRENPQVLLYSSKFDEDDEYTTFFKKEGQYYAIEKAETYKINKDNFKNLSYQTGADLFKESFTKWNLLNNVNSLEKIFNIMTSLKYLRDNNYTLFNQELWLTVRSLLGTKEIITLYNDLGDNKEQLQLLAMSGTRKHKIRKATEPEHWTYEKYSDYSNLPFEICEHSKDKGELLFIININSTYILYMTKICFLNRLQISMLTALFNGLQE